MWVINNQFQLFSLTGIIDYTEPQTFKYVETPVQPQSEPVSVKYRSEQKQQKISVGYPDRDTTEVAHIYGDSDVVAVKPSIAEMDSAGVYVIAIVAGISAAATVGLIAVGIGWYK